MEEHRSFFKVVGRFFSIIFLIILIPYFIVSCIITYSAVTNFDNLPSVFGYKPVIIKNNEMKKDLYKGDLLIIKTEETYSLLPKGTIITYQESTDHFKTREISTVVSSPKVDENTEAENLDSAEYRLKASSKENADSGSIMSNQIEGVYFFRIPAIGTYLSYIENRWLLVVSLPVLGLLIVLFMMAAIKWAPKKVEKKEEKKELELMSAAELTTGVNLRDDLLQKASSKAKNPQNNQVTPQTPQPQPQVIVTQQPQVQQVPQQNTTPTTQATGGDFGGGITIAPPTENPQPTPTPEQSNVQQAPQIQVVPPTEVIPPQPFAQQSAAPQQPQQQPTVVPQNNNQTPPQQ